MADPAGLGRAAASGHRTGSGDAAAPGGGSPRLGLLSSPTAQALRAELPSLTVWVASVGAFALIVGLVANSVSSAGISRQLDRAVAKLGSGAIVSAKDYLGLSLLFFVLAISLFVCAQVAAARHEEAQRRLETLLALPVSRRAWLGGRLLLAAAGRRRSRFAPGCWRGRAVVDLTPFADVGLVPARAFRGGAAAVMLAIGVGAAVVACLSFERRDLAGA